MTNGDWMIIEGEVLHEDVFLRFEEFCARLHVDRQWVDELVAIGALEPTGGPAPTEWSFSMGELRRARTLARLVSELDVDVHGAAIIADLLEERRRLMTQLQRLLG